jgi:hypothetical protein
MCTIRNEHRECDGPKADLLQAESSACYFPTDPVAYFCLATTQRGCACCTDVSPLSDVSFNPCPKEEA